MPGSCPLPCPTPNSSHPHPRRPARGFTLIELAVVVVLVAILATMGFVALVNVRQRNAISLAPKQLMTAMAAARSEAALNAQDVVFVLVGNTGPAQAALCGRSLFPSQDTRCVRYWILKDEPPTAFNATDLTSFSSTTPFIPNTVAAPSGDLVLGGGYLPASIYLGRGPGYTPPAAPGFPTPYSTLWAPTNLLTVSSSCSFCTMVAGAPRGFIRYDARGRTKVETTNGTDPLGGVIYLNAASGGAGTPDTRTVAIFEPLGITTDRLGRRQ